MNTYKDSPDLQEKPRSGLCEPNLINEAIQKAGAIAPAFSFVPPPARWDAFLPLSPEQRDRAYSLVKASKSPTKEIERVNTKKLAFKKESALLQERHAHMLETGEISPNPIREFERHPERVGHKAPGIQCIVEQRKWAGEYRIRNQVETTVGQRPPEQSGPRLSQYLSDNGFRSLTESAAYMQMERGGYTTFVTLTVSDEKRADLKAGKTTIQREASRCFDAWNKMYQRGLKREGIPGNDDTLDYLWVVEVPDNARGEANPHIHVLMRWSVPYEKFDGWAKRLERAWGMGFAKLEKMKSSKGAGAYIAKAVGYLCKAQGKSDQGEVRGNRYGISESARAPGWEVLTKMQMDCMGQLISDVYDHLTFKHGQDYKDRKKLNWELDEARRAAKAARKASGKGKPPAWMTGTIKILEARQKAVRERLDALPLRANRYQVILKSDKAYEEFMAWACNPKFNQDIAPWLPEKPEGVAYSPGAYPKPRDGLYFVQLRNKFQENKRKRWAVTDDVCAHMVEQELAMRDDSLDAYSDYDAWASQQPGSTEAALAIEFCQ